MTTGELIEWLKQEDPTGKLPVCVDNEDIYFLEELPSYYDGKLQRIIQDKTKNGYNVIGAKWISSGKKVKIHTMGVSGSIENDPNVRIDYTDIILSSGGDERVLEYKDRDDRCRAETRAIIKEVHDESEEKKAKENQKTV